MSSNLSVVFVSGDEERQAKGGISKGSGVFTPTGARDKSWKGAAICGVTS
jgi:hypothetical protein